MAVEEIKAEIAGQEKFVVFLNASLKAKVEKLMGDMDGKSGTKRKLQSGKKRGKEICNHKVIDGSKQQQHGPGPAATTTSTTSAPDTTTAAAITGVPGATGRLGSSAVVASDEFQQQSQSGQHQRPPATTAGDGPRPSSPQLRNANSWSVPALHHNSEPNVGMNQSQDGFSHFQTEQQQQQFYAQQQQQQQQFYAQQQQQQQQPAIPIIQPFEGSFKQGAMHAPVDMIQNQHHQQAPEPVQLAQALLPIPNEHLIIHDVTAASVKRNNGVDESMDEEEFSPRLQLWRIQKSKQEHTRKFSKLSLSLRKTNIGQECPLCR
ncbi:hypothetical protein DAPPUDRAFT_269371 [Daphnia pulex]|uniref:Uncharacterized protein n=1 Tax=Daphnia pulex TaxID=6669 RepID=E9HZ85_DAPPU|nr:hypothetical protein DAPPUDRAFT_269371 [Daphnia pulex]|eukprot:EFX62945.1 hypothetical protein DAPPUDRAFT_269371 [Daphnia pulex]